MEPRRSRYKKSRGPRTQPCGIPYDKGAEEGSDPARLTDQLNPSTVPQIPKKVYKHDIKVLWSIRSKAGVKSSRTRMTNSPESFARRMSLKALHNADSVEGRV